MSGLGIVFVFVLLLALSATYSGSETGMYSLSRARLEVESRAGGHTARLLLRLLRNDAALLITLLVGNNLMIELATHLAQARMEELLESAPSGVSELVVALLLTPLLFLFGELLPKDFFRRRPNVLLHRATWILAASRVAFLPIALPMQALTGGLERLVGLRQRDLARVLGREEVLELVSQGKREGSLAEATEELARNVLALRATRLADVMTPWSRVLHLDLDGDPELTRTLVRDSEFTRLPAVRSVEGRRRVEGYVHQLDALSDPERPLDELVRPIPTLEADQPVDRALSKMRTSGQRVALVGPAEEPVGLVALMDLVAVIAG